MLKFTRFCLRRPSNESTGVPNSGAKISAFQLLSHTIVAFSKKMYHILDLYQSMTMTAMTMGYFYFFPFTSNVSKKPTRNIVVVPSTMAR